MKKILKTEIMIVKQIKYKNSNDVAGYKVKNKIIMMIIIIIMLYSECNFCL